MPRLFVPVLLLSCLLPTASLASYAAPAAPKTRLLKISGFTYLPEESTILLPMKGPRQRWKIFLEPGGRVAFMEIPWRNGAARLVRKTQSLNPTSGILARILVANNRPNVVRIAARGRQAIRFVPEVELGEGDRWLLKIRVLPYRQKAPEAPKPIVRPTPLPTPRPRVIPPRKGIPTPVPTEPPTPVPTAVPTAIPTPSLAPPEPSVVTTPVPTPTPTPEPEPLSRVEVTRRTINLAENYPAGGSHNVTVNGISAWEIGWTQRHGAWSTRAEIGLWDPYTIVDIDLVGSRHVRRETTGKLLASWHTEVIGQPFSLGGGLFARHLSNTSTVEPLVPSYLFSKQHLYTGLLLEARSQVRVWGPFRLVLGAEANPLTLPFFDADVDSAGILVGAGGEAGLEMAWKSLALRGTYRIETLRSPDFTSFAQNARGWNIGLVYRY